VPVPSYDEYVATLSRLTEHVDPTTPTAETAAIKAAAESLDALGPVDVITLEEWTRDNPQAVAALRAQLHRTYTFGDVLVARAGTRVTAVAASTSGRVLEDRIEAIAVELGLTYETRTRFEGRFGRTAPCDLAIPAGGAAAQIVVAAKAFDSTGSKLTDAVRGASGRRCGTVTQASGRVIVRSAHLPHERITRC
jgi:hypothetical protein